jgi:uncharacterized membrane protein YeiH
MQLIAVAYSYGRIVLGASGLLAPGPVGRAFGIGEGPLAQVAARHIAARDLVAGVGIVMADRRGRARGWYEAAALTDAIDAGVALVSGATGAMDRRRSLAVAVLAGASAATGMVLARRATDEP